MFEDIWQDSRFVALMKARNENETNEKIWKDKKQYKGKGLEMRRQKSICNLLNTTNYYWLLLVLTSTN